MAPVRVRLLLVRMTAVHDHVDGVEPVFEETLVGLEFERIRHDAGGVGQHAVLRHDGKTLDAAGLRHARGLSVDALGRQGLGRASAGASGVPWPVPPGTGSLRCRGRASGWSSCRKAIICSRASQRSSNACPELAALMMARTSMADCLVSVTCSAAVLPSQFLEAATICLSFSRMMPIGAR